MKIVIFGASGSVGRYLIAEAVRQGHEVIAVGRQVSSLQPQAHVTVKAVDYNQPADLVDAAKGADAAIISLGDLGVVQPTEAIIQALQAVDITRVEILTGFGGSRWSRWQLNPVMHAIVWAARLAYYRGFHNKELQDRIIRNSGLTFTIVQPPTLTFDAATGTYRHGDYRGKSLLGHISRADLTEFMVTNLTAQRYQNQSVFVQQ